MMPTIAKSETETSAPSQINTLKIGPAELRRGDVRELLRGMPDNSVDSIVTDPPYELGFMGKGWDKSGIANDSEMWAEAMRVLKPGGHLLAFSSSRTYHRMACAIEDGGFEIRDQIMWIYGSGMPKGEAWTQTKADKGGAESATMIEAGYEGWARAGLKPAHEPICVARKPFAGSVAANVLVHGTGAINVDACRIATDEVLAIGSGGTLDALKKHEGRTGSSAGRRYGAGGNDGFAMLPGARQHVGGRWPANIIHDGSTEVLVAFPDAKGQQGALTGAEPSSRTRAGLCYGSMDRGHASEPRVESDTNAARFFYCAKASRTDRNEGCEHLVRRPLNWSSGVANPGSFQSEGTDKSSYNHHPTVKPTDLMAYLCRLITPAGGLVLDLFCGSGSTGKACVREGFRFIGFDKDEDDYGSPLGFLQISAARIRHEIAAVARRAAEVDMEQRLKSRQSSIFDAIES